MKRYELIAGAIIFTGQTHLACIAAFTARSAQGWTGHVATHGHSGIRNAR